VCGSYSVWSYLAMEINEDTLDYIRTKLSESVQTNVENRLFKLYRAYLYTALAIMTFIGIPSILIYASTRIDSQIDSQITKRTEEPVKKAVDAADKAAIGLQLIDAKAEEKSKSIQRELDSLEERRNALDKEIKESRLAVLSINSDITDVKNYIEDFKKSVETLRVSLGQKYASFGALDDLKTQTQALSEQVSSLGSALKSLASGVNTPAVVSEAGQAADQSGEIQRNLATQLSSAEEVTKPTVFVQFAGSSRDQINELITEIGTGDKYILPGAERLSAAAGKHLIRYYYEKDRESALKLQIDTNEALTRLGYRRVAIDDPIIPPGVKKPQRGVLELWLELPLRSQ
jgi:hypothetical protein